MPVCRVVFSLDFNINYEIINAPGKVMELLNESVDNFWSTLGENPTGRRITAINESEEQRWGRNFSVRPNRIGASFEKHEGISIKNIANDDVFHKLVKITNKVREQFHIKNLQRCGLRLFYFAKLGSKKDEVKQAFQKMLDKPLVDGILPCLGEIQDIGIVVDGVHEDKIKYHFRCGPYFKGEADKKKYLQYFGDKFDQTENFDMVCDIDLYEHSFSLTEMVSFAKWCNPLLNKAQKFINLFESLLLKNMGG